MTLFAKLASAIWRDFQTDGVPATGVYDPVKSDIRQWAGSVEATILAGGFNGGLVYPSQADLDADLDHAPNTSAWVIGDADVSNDGVYRKIGASGSGSWARIADLPYSIVRADNAGTGTPDAIQATTSLAPPETPLSALFLVNIVADNTGPVTLSFNGETPRSLLSDAGNELAAAELVTGQRLFVIDNGADYRTLKGAKGDAGDAATIAVGNVVTLPPGSDVTFVNVGNDNDAVFDIGIPRGDPGATGDGSGNVIGPAGATSGNLPVFADNTGTVLADSGVSPDEAGPTNASDLTNDSDVEGANVDNALNTLLRPPVVEKTASHILELSDAGTILEMNVAAANTVTIPLDADVSFPLHTHIRVIQTGTGATSVTGAGGVTLNPSDPVALADQFTSLTLIKVGTDSWLAISSGTGNALQQGKHTIWVPAVAMLPRLTAGAEFVDVELGTSGNTLRTLDFDQTTIEGAGFMVAMPKSWDEGPITFQSYWTAFGGAGGVALELSAVATSDDDPLNVGLGTGIVAIDTKLTDGDCHVSPESAPITIGGSPTENDLVQFALRRVTSDAADTLTTDLKLIGIKLFVTINEATDD